MVVDTIDAGGIAFGFWKERFVLVLDITCMYGNAYASEMSLVLMILMPGLSSQGVNWELTSSSWPINKLQL